MFNVHALAYWQRLEHQVILTRLVHTVIMGLQEEGGCHLFHTLALEQTHSLDDSEPAAWVLGPKHRHQHKHERQPFTKGFKRIQEMCNHLHYFHRMIN